MSRTILYLIMLGNLAFLVLFILPGAPKGLESASYLKLATRLKALEQAGVISIHQEAAEQFYNRGTSWAVSMIAADAAHPAARTINGLCVGLMAIAALNGLAAMVGLLACRHSQPCATTGEPEGINGT